MQAIRILHMVADQKVASWPSGLLVVLMVC